MADDDEIDSVELTNGTQAEAVKFVKDNIDAEAKSIEVVKVAASNTYTCTARGLPTE